MKKYKLQTIREFVIKNGYKSLKGKRILNINDDKIYYIHERCFIDSMINDFKDYDKQPYQFRVYGGENEKSENVYWIYSNYYVVPDNFIL